MLSFCKQRLNLPLGGGVCVSVGASAAEPGVGSLSPGLSHSSVSLPTDIRLELLDLRSGWTSHKVPT